MANTNQQGNWKTYVFKIDFSCCDECPIKLKDRLLNKLCGVVDTVEVDAKQNTVDVKSSLDSKIIIKKIEEWGKKAVLLHEKKENNPHGYIVEELNEDDDEEKGKPSKPPACSHKSSSSSRSGCKNKSSSTHEPQSYNSSQKNTEVPEHICKDKHCTYHNREPYVDAGINYRPLFRGGHYPIGNFYPPPPPPPPMYVPRMMPPVAGHYSGGYSIHRPRNDVFTDVFSDEYSNGCSTMYDVQMGVHDPYENCVAAMRLYKRMRYQHHPVEVAPNDINYMSEPAPAAPDLDNSYYNIFDRIALEDLEKMTPDELFKISKSNYQCWCLDSAAEP